MAAQAYDQRIVHGATGETLTFTLTDQGTSTSVTGKTGAIHLDKFLTVAGANTTGTPFTKAVTLATGQATVAFTTSDFTTLTSGYYYCEIKLTDGSSNITVYPSKGRLILFIDDAVSEL